MLYLDVSLLRLSPFSLSLARGLRHIDISIFSCRASLADVRIYQRPVLARLIEFFYIPADPSKFRIF